MNFLTLMTYEVNIPNPIYRFGAILYRKKTILGLRLYGYKHLCISTLFELIFFSGADYELFGALEDNLH